MIRNIVFSCLCVILSCGVLSAGEQTLIDAPLIGPGRIGAPPPSERLIIPKSAEMSRNFLFDLCVEGAMLRHDTPGAGVAIIENGVMIHERGYGVKKRNTNDPITPHTYFRIGSVTKQFTTAAVMQQVEIGSVNLRDRVTEYIPELTIGGWRPATDIRIDHLLTHTSGYPDNFMDLAGTTTPDALSEWISTQSLVRLHAPPGSFWNYSNPNFSLAGLVVERASGIPYHEYMETRIFDAAGLDRTTLYPQTVIDDGDWSWGHMSSDPNAPEQFYEPDAYDNWAFAPAGYAFSTAGDLARWATLLIEGGHDVISAPSTKAMQAPHVKIEIAPGSSYGYGIMHEHYNGFELQHHGGNIPGWGTFLLWIPEKKVAIAVLANTFESLGDAAYCIVDSVYHPPGGEAPNLDIDPSKWPSFVGTYSGYNSIGTALHTDVFLDGDFLLADLVNTSFPADHVEGILVPIFLDTFLFDLDGDGIGDLDLTFHTSEGNPGRVEWLVNRSVVGARDMDPRTGHGRSGQ